MRTLIAVALIGVAYTSSNISLAQQKSTKQPDAQSCFMGECYLTYIASLRKESSGLIIARTRSEFHCVPGFECDPKETRPPMIGTSKFSCKNPGGYIEDERGNRTPEPVREPQHYEQAAKDLWEAVCLKLSPGQHAETVRQSSPAYRPTTPVSQQAPELQIPSPISCGWLIQSNPNACHKGLNTVTRQVYLPPGSQYRLPSRLPTDSGSFWAPGAAYISIVDCRGSVFNLNGSIPYAAVDYHCGTAIVKATTGGFLNID
jgi:hypothetical protein